jgi:hypothetical protein
LFPDIFVEHNTIANFVWRDEKKDLIVLFAIEKISKYPRATLDHERTDSEHTEFFDDVIDSILVTFNDNELNSVRNQQFNFAYIIVTACDDDSSAVVSHKV